MQAFVFTLAILLISTSLVQAICEKGEIREKCYTGYCTPYNMCHLCQCLEFGVWDCSYGRNGSCGAGGEYFELGVFGNYKYMYSLNRKNFSEAATACSELEGGLASFDTTAEHNAVISFIAQGPQWVRSRNILFGARNSGSGWKWIDDSDINRHLYPKSWRYTWEAWWSQNTEGEDPLCLVMQPFFSLRNKLWEPKPCTDRNYFLCKLPKDAIVPTYTGPEPLPLEVD